MPTQEQDPRTPAQRYLAALASAADFAKAAGTQSTPTDLPAGTDPAAATKALDDVRAVAVEWFSVVYPPVLALSRAVVNEDQGIGAQLRSLIDPGCRPAGGPGDDRAAKPEIEPAVAELARRVDRLEGQAATLHLSLITFGMALRRVGRALTAATADLLNDVRCRDAQVHADRARLDSLEHASCSDRNDLAAAGRVLHEDGLVFDAVLHFHGQLSRVGEQLAEAHNGISYLDGAWSLLADEARRVKVGLAAAARDTGEAARKLDFQKVERSWARLVAHSREILDAAPPPPSLSDIQPTTAGEVP
ncbi:hypothetical protein ACIGXM_27335 [Kitasatospora sp. NPDC052896]|uniref:hypothetical protein n=1 Tax=Kitasatospora sp. NPDC052896 TaxID=3364061 RepID=UPI0037C6451E